MSRSTTFVPAVPGGRPAMPALEAELTDTWLVPNGIVGLIPEGSTITVAGGQITWPRWRHLNANSRPWERDVMVASDLWPAGKKGDPKDKNVPVVDERTVPLRKPVTDRVRELFELTSGLTLVEE